ncbi:unannotated protein [freshwater metagenome]|uniref:Unannotated protein n=1 Tax=freshwater metagenome TaxID=449393 RepID=A0A6J7E0E2_9ZZZZ|nr:vitamin K epoxide reductase family protein [Actinomycetota bacterium]MUH58600.1 Vitamin K epoxide reductase [Actinomycetota bacterium]
MDNETPSTPKGIVWASFVLSIVGVAISTYLTIAHYKGAEILACADTGIVNCATVTTSAQSKFLGLPVSNLGLTFFLAMVVINSPWVWRRNSLLLDRTRVICLVGGMGFVLWLIAAELLIIDHICLWCTGVHVVTFALLLVISRTWSSELLRRSN